MDRTMPTEPIAGARAAPPFVGAGEMARLMRELDWSTTPLGPVEAWPEDLRAAVSICLNFRLPFALYWGPKYTMLYNDAFRPQVGDKHPWCLGRPGQEVWPEIWGAIGPMWQNIRETGEGVFFEDSVYFMERHGYLEECYFSFNLSAAWGSGGQVEGLVNFASETTYRVLNERRAACARALLASLAQARTLADVYASAVAALGTDPADVPYAALYQVEGRDRHASGLAPYGPSRGGSAALVDRRARRVGAVGVPDGHPLAPDVVDLRRGRAACARALAAALKSGLPVRAEGPSGATSDLCAGPWPEPVRESWAIPVNPAGGGDTQVILLVGVSPRRAFDDAYREFFEGLGRHIGVALANARAHEDEALRRAKLAEIERAKAAFFDNVSHEFRTPLTLLLGRTEEALAAVPARLEGGDLQSVHRNGLRLLKLVNSLLDLSDLTHAEGAQAEARWVAVELAAETASVVAGFQPAMERAGLTLAVDCPSLGAPVLVDREMWEKILLNLLSNALKYTEAGTVTVSLRADEVSIRLVVRDTGLGIPSTELPRIFDRFHRVAGNRARGQESTGIGLTLVREFAQRLGGGVEVESEVGRGSAFTVSFPRRVAPDGADGHGAAPPRNAPAALSLAAYWAESEPVSQPRESAAEAPEAGSRARVLVVDDNPEILAHVKRLLEDEHVVQLANSASDALERIRTSIPDLVLADVMMPDLDGLGLLGALRADPKTLTLPVVLMSARADQTSTVDGLQAGADDYLTKPFSAQELRARVRAHLRMARERTKAAEALRTANAVLEARVAERTSELASALTEMRAFTFSASHDLRSPLRAIDGFSHILLDDYSDRLDGEAIRLLQRIRVIAQRMAQLIDAILEFGKLGRTPLSPERLALDSMAREIAESLRAGAPTRQVEVVVAPNLCAYGDTRLIHRLLQNLLDNAWKFTESQVNARIEFGTRMVGNERVFFIADNGRGFDMAYADKLFEPFQRLHKDSVARGHGMGLAACHEIVRRHGGRIAGEGAPGVGATFSFTLPEEGKVS